MLAESLMKLQEELNATQGELQKTSDCRSNMDNKYQTLLAEHRELLTKYVSQDSCPIDYSISEIDYSISEINYYFLRVYNIKGNIWCNMLMVYGKLCRITIISVPSS